MVDRKSLSFSSGKTALLRARKGQSKIRKIKAQIHDGYNADLGFLHIPKTGGSSLSAFGRKLVCEGQPFPCKFSHGWRFAGIRKHFPRVKLVFIIRDPLERAISGFNSRLRQGRPTYNSMWGTAEAAAFAHFPTVKHYLDALLGEDDYSRSASAYAAKTVAHLRWNYVFYFQDTSAIAAGRDSIALVGEINKTDRFTKALCDRIGVPDAMIDRFYKMRHESNVKSADVLSSYSQDQIKSLRESMKEEYDIYDCLREMSV